jgi:hypothetical protein
LNLMYELYVCIYVTRCINFVYLAFVELYVCY